MFLSGEEVSYFDLVIAMDWPRLIPQDTMRHPRSREPASAGTASGDREELLPPPWQAAGNGNPCRSKDTLGRRRSLDLQGPWGALTPKLFSFIPWHSIVAIYISSAGGADNSYFAC